MGILDVFKGFSKQQSREGIKFNKGISPEETELLNLVNKEIKDEKKLILQELKKKKNNEIFGGGFSAKNDILGAKNIFTNEKKPQESSLLKQKNLF